MASEIVIGVDIFGFILGISVIISMLIVLKNFRGVLRKTQIFIIFGILFQILALLYTLIFSRFQLIPVPGGVDIHHLLMIIGVIFFALGAFNLRKIVSAVKNSEK